MAGYTRLITYAYDYQRKERMKNVGSARIERKGNQIKITFDIRIPSLSGQTLNGAFYKRSIETMLAIPFAELPIEEGRLTDKITFSYPDPEGDTIAFEELDGMVLYASSDKSIVADWKNKTLTREELTQIENRITLLFTLAKEKINQNDIKSENPDTAAEEAASKEAQTQESGSCLITDNLELKERNADTKGDGLQSQEKEKQKESYLQSQEKAVNHKEGYLQLEDSNDICHPCHTNHPEQSKIKETNQNQAAITNGQKEQLKDGSANQVSSQAISQARPDNDQKGFLWKDTPLARRILTKFPRVYPFDDSEIAECVKIEPKNIGLFPMEAWSYGNNSFLVHSFCNYRHILFAKKQTREGCKYLLMVPGIHNDREKYMARMFGFEYFKCARPRNKREGEFGYWYTYISF